MLERWHLFDRDWPPLSRFSIDMSLLDARAPK
jgi:hypothetical protein